jgi:hypothetical protein
MCFTPDKKNLLHLKKQRHIVIFMSQRERERERQRERERERERARARARVRERVRKRKGKVKRRQKRERENNCMADNISKPPGPECKMRELYYTIQERAV